MNKIIEFKLNNQQSIDDNLFLRKSKANFNFVNFLF